MLKVENTFGVRNNNVPIQIISNKRSNNKFKIRRIRLLFNLEIRSTEYKTSKQSSGVEIPLKQNLLICTFA